MPRSAVGALRMALVGGLSGIAWLTLVLAWAPDVNFNMDRDQPGVMSGFYPVERNGDETFAWTRARADVRLAGLDRRSPWQCVVRVRGGRSDGIPQPVVEIAADGVVLVRRTATNEYQELIVAIPARPNASGLTLSIASSETVVPGPSDPRQLGIQINSISFRPATRFVLPPRRAVVPAFLAGAMFGAAFGAILPTSGALPGTMALTAGAAIPLATTAGPFSPRYQRDVVHAAA
ncbi:MAG TPA: hypothetical protein VFZ98_07845, partial [Vicinamibacterales bacterium]